MAFLFTTGHGHDSNSVLWFRMSPVTSTQQPVGPNQSPDLWKVGMYNGPMCPEGEGNRMRVHILSLYPNDAPFAYREMS